jgi:hypothetical protein
MARLLLWICVTAICMWSVESKVLVAVMLKELVFQVVVVCRWVSGSRPFDESCCLELEYQALRCTVRAPNIFGFTVCNLLHVTLWHLESWCSCTCRKFVYRYASVLVILHRVCCTWNKPRPRKRLSLILIRNDWSFGVFLERFSVKCCNTVRRSRVEVLTSVSCRALS